jgi:hypothetical protein
MLGQGKEAAKQYLRENPKTAKEITEAIWKIVRSGTAQQKVVLGKEDKED